MKYQEIATLLNAAGLAVPSAEQLHALARTPGGAPFGAALRHLAAGDAGAAEQLRSVIKAMVENEPHSPAAAASAAPPNSPQSSAAPYYSFHVYGASGALCVSEAKVRSSGAHTIQIEAALALQAPGAGRRIDWGNKIAVQLNEEETFLCLALFKGQIQQLRFTGHGATHDKVIELDRQSRNFRVRVLQRGRNAVVVPVSAAEGLKFVSLAFRQILANAPHLNMATVQDMVDGMAAMHRNLPRSADAQ